MLDFNRTFPLSLSLGFSPFFSIFLTLRSGKAAAIFKGKPLPGSLIEGSKYSFLLYSVCCPHLSSFPTVCLFNTLVSFDTFFDAFIFFFEILSLYTWTT